ncbi:MAG: hypothetical protein IJR00_08110 [Lachnospiraceae bacterium]|nr:hypothetical protein [Lachnospiraceae bacterium]
MPATPANQRAVKKYKDANYMRIELPVRKEFGETIKAAAAAAGESVTAYVSKAVKAYMDNENGK